MKRARDVREQLVGLMQRVEMDLVSGISETANIRKVIINLYDVEYKYAKITKYSSTSVTLTLFYRQLQLDIFTTSLDYQKGDTIKLPSTIKRYQYIQTVPFSKNYRDGFYTTS